MILKHSGNIREKYTEFSDMGDNIHIFTDLITFGIFVGFFFPFIRSNAIEASDHVRPAPEVSKACVEKQEEYPRRKKEVQSHKQRLVKKNVFLSTSFLLCYKNIKNGITCILTSCLGLINVKRRR